MSLGSRNKNFDEVNIIDRYDNYKNRMILEMTYVAGSLHAVNQRADTGNLSVFYIPLKRKIVISPQNVYLLSTCVKIHIYKIPMKIKKLSKINYYESY